MEIGANETRAFWGISLSRSISISISSFSFHVKFLAFPFSFGSVVLRSSPLKRRG